MHSQLFCILPTGMKICGLKMKNIKKKMFREMFELSHLHQWLKHNNNNKTKSYLYHLYYSTAIINDNLTDVNANTKIRDFGSNLVAAKA